MKSPELGLVGNVGCKLYWDPTYLTRSDKKRKNTTSEDRLEMIEVASTRFLASSSPEWNMMKESEIAKRIKHVIPGDTEHFEESNGKASEWNEVVSFPVLQPFLSASQLSDSMLAVRSN